MKRVSMFLMCLFAIMLASQNVKAQDVTITLIPGWTWISYPKAEVMDVATALGDFVPMEGDIIQSQYANTTYRNGQWRGRLQQFTPGLGYMYYSTRVAPATLVFGGSTPQAQVQVTTSEPMLITAISAMGGGEVTTTDGTYIIVKGLCWAAHENPTTNDDFYEEAESGVGTFSISMTELNIATTYYVRAYAVTPNGTVYGDQKSFTTRDGIPEVSTAEVTNILGNGAICGGTVTDNGGLNVTARGVCWSTSQNPTVSDSHTTNGSGLGGFTSSITGLSVSTTYYVRAYATTSQGTTYGEEVSFTTRDGIPEVSTASVTSILGHSATSGGTVTDNCGLTITARGICWSTNHNPTIVDNHTLDEEEEWGEKYYCEFCSFTNIMTELALNTIYYVRAYATTVAGTGYGEEICFTTQSSSVGQYVDLGLPSGTLWATCNVGADSPEDYGDYFAWGETQPKDVYEWSTYQYCMGSYNTLTKYCNNASYGYNGFIDNLTTLLPEDDAATANWGSDWRMPTKAEYQELCNNTNCIWTLQNGVPGQLFTAANGNSLFLPAASNYLMDYYYVYYGIYWSSSLCTYSPDWSCELEFGSGYCGIYEHNDAGFGGVRCIPQSIRAVRCKNSIINVTSNPTEGGSVSGGGTYMDQNSCTITASANEGYAFTWWTENGEVVSTDASYSFTVNGNRNLVANFNATYNGYAYVDLGLPSGLLWATCNVGADAPEAYGDYFAWGETTPKDTYTWESYIFAEGTSWEDPRLTKYCNDHDLGYNGFTDDLTTLLPEDDAATANWGVGWRMPTREEWIELKYNTTYTWTTQNGVNGILFTASNGNSLFLPANSGLYSAGSDCEYWSSSLDTLDDSSYAWCFYFDYVEAGSRCTGCSVRPVCSSRQN